MNRSAIAGSIVAALLVAAPVTRLAAQTQPPAAQAAQAAAPDQVLALGKEVFTASCAKCHNVDALKKLPDGTTLIERLLKSDDPPALADTRLKKLGKVKRDAAWAYLALLMKQARAGATTG